MQTTSQTVATVPNKIELEAERDNLLRTERSLSDSMNDYPNWDIRTARKRGELRRTRKKLKALNIKIKSLT